MAHGGISAAVVGRVMALGAELERNLVPGISGSGCSSSDVPREEANISHSARGKARQWASCWSRILDFSTRKEERDFYS